MSHSHTYTTHLATTLFRLSRAFRTAATCIVFGIYDAGGYYSENGVMFTLGVITGYVNLVVIRRLDIATRAPAGQDSKFDWTL